MYNVVINLFNHEIQVFARENDDVCGKEAASRVLRAVPADGDDNDESA